MKITSIIRIKAALVLLLGLSAMQMANATIISAVDVTATDSFPSPIFGTAENLINQGGLLTGYTSGVTDFDTYIASNPLHSQHSAGNEWFTDFNISSALLTFNLGTSYLIDGIAVWVDEHWGVGTIDVAVSTDNVTYTNVGGFNPTDWPLSTDYGADVFRFAATSAQYVQLALSGCPQPISAEDGGCGMGEVAFRAADASVPEPSTLALLCTGLLLVGFSKKRLNS